MQVKDLQLQLYDTVQDQVTDLIRELGLLPIAELLNDPTTDEKTSKVLKKLLEALTDIFSTSLPKAGDPEETLEQAARDIRISRLFRERGLFRIYRLTHESIDGVAVFQYFINPYTDSPFANQTEFLRWFCDEAKVPKSLVFMRMAAIERMEALGFSLEEAYEIIMTKPWAVHESLRMIADWEKGGVLSDINPHVAEQLAMRTHPEMLPGLQQAIEEMEEGEEGAHEKYLDIVKPMVSDLMREVANHESASEAMNFIKYDILQLPEIRYSWEPNGEYIMIELVQIAREENGQTYELPPVKIPLVPDINFDLPRPVKEDLIKRLPIRNKSNIELD